jgi:hypothetical protein
MEQMKLARGHPAACEFLGVGCLAGCSLGEAATGKEILLHPDGDETLAERKLMVEQPLKLIRTMAWRAAADAHSTPAIVRDEDLFGEAEPNAFVVARAPDSTATQSFWISQKISRR